VKQVELRAAPKPSPLSPRFTARAATTSHSRLLEMQRAIGNRATARVLARQPANYPAGGWTLLYKDELGSYFDSNGNLRWRKIDVDDREFKSDYIDSHIDHATVTVDLDTGDWGQMEVYWHDGRKKTFKRGELPTTFYYGAGRRARGVGAVHLDSFERHDEDEFIYPAYNGSVILTPYTAPNLTSLRDQAEENSRELVRLRKLAFITGEFLNIMGLYGIAVGELQTIRDMPHPTAGSRSRRGIGVRNATEADPSFAGGVPREEPTSKQTGLGGEPDRPPVSMRLPDTPTPRRQQQQQHQQPGVRLHPPDEQHQPTAQDPERRSGQRQQQQQQQQGQTRDARTRRRQGDRYSEGAELGLSRESVDALRAEIIRRPKIEKPPPPGQDAAPNQLDLSRLAADHRGANSHFDLSDPAKIDIIVSTINDPQAILVSKNGSWTFWKNGTVVVTERGAVNAMRTAYGRGGRIPPRDIARARLVNPAARVGDPEAPVPLDALLDADVRADFQAFKIWP
jgi:hypothetical protein